MVQVVDNVSHRAGAHALRAGVDFLYNDDTITFLRTFRGSYTFSSLANFLAGNYNGFAQTFGDPVITQTNPNVGLYAQDEWRAGSRLTLNLGLRYDLQFLETIDTDTQQRLAAGRLRLDADRLADARRPRRRRHLLRSRAAPRRRQRAALGRQHHRRDAAASAAGVRASCRRRPARRSSRASCRIACRRRPSSRSRRWTADLQNAYSKQANLEVERALGGSRDASPSATSTSAARTC